MGGWMFVPNRPFSSNQHLGRVYGIARLVIMTVLAVFSVIFFAYVFGSLLFSGGQLATTEEVRWDAVVPHPLFTPPLPVMVGLCILAAIASVVCAVTARLRDMGDLPFLVLMPPTVLGMMSSALAYFFDDPNGPEMPAKWGITRLSMYWLGVPFVVAGGLAALVAYIVLLVVKRRHPDRIPEYEGYAGGDLSRLRETITGDPKATRAETEREAQRMLDEFRSLHPGLDRRGMRKLLAEEEQDRQQPR